MVRLKNDFEIRLKMLEKQVELLTSAFGGELGEGQMEFASRKSRPPSLSFAHAREGNSPQPYGAIEAGDFGNGYQALRVSSAGAARLDLTSNGDTLLQAGRALHLNAPNIKIEARRVDIDGDLSACLRRSEFFEWKSGQPPARLVHQSQGVPVLAELHGKFRNSASGIKMYVDPEDGYWYLNGDSSKGAEISARVICIGRV